MHDTALKTDVCVFAWLTLTPCVCLVYLALLRNGQQQDLVVIQQFRWHTSGYTLNMRLNVNILNKKTENQPLRSHQIITSQNLKYM